MNPTILAILRGVAETVAIAVLTGAGVYSQTNSIRLAAVASVTAGASSVLTQLLPAGAVSKLAQSAPTSTTGATK